MFFMSTLNVHGNQLKHGEPKREHTKFQNPHKPATNFGQTQKTLQLQNPKMNKNPSLIILAQPHFITTQ